MSLDLKEVTLAGFLTCLADRTPTPGGGAVAAVSLAIAGAIGHMAIAYSKGRSSLAEYDSLHDEAMSSLSSLATSALDLAEQDFTMATRTRRVNYEKKRARKEAKSRSPTVTICKQHGCCTHNRFQ